MSGCHPPENNDKCMCIYCLAKILECMSERLALLEKFVKKPHKCPICKGFGLIEKDSMNYTCKGCDGKCIVWG